MSKILFEIGYLLKRPAVLKYYKSFMYQENLHYEFRLENQWKQVKRMIEYAYDHITYYKNLFESLNITPNDIRSTEDFQKIPILTKDIIKRNLNDFFPKNMHTIKTVSSSTGGSTGQPLKYWMTSDDYSMGVALLYRGFGMGGYKLGDKMAVVAGGSLLPNNRNVIKQKIYDYFLNQRHFSSFDLSDVVIEEIILELNKWKPKYLRGYSSSLYILARNILKYRLHLSFELQAIFSTAEKLLSHQRLIIEKAFQAPVFDGYGLNDGGLSAFECKFHSGMHVDMERAYCEVVDDQGKSVDGKQGKIIATSLYNYSFPFIRYDTGDRGTVIFQECSCGRKGKVITSIEGRSTDVIEMNGKKIGSPVFTVLFGKFDIEQYQIIQKQDDCLIIKIVKGPEFSNQNEEYISKVVRSHVGDVKIIYNYCDTIIPYNGAKHKFIVRE